MYPLYHAAIIQAIVNIVLVDHQHIHLLSPLDHRVATPNSLSLYSSKISSSSSSSIQHGSALDSAPAAANNGAANIASADAPVHAFAAQLADRSAAYWSDGNRYTLYPIPGSHHHDVWTAIRRIEHDDQLRQTRILYSRNTHGYIVYDVLPDGTAVVTNWTLLPDLLMLDPISYFLAHPRVNSIYCETTDTDEYSVSTGDNDDSSLHTIGIDASSSTIASDDRSTAGSSDASSISNFALVISRDELTYEVATLIRDRQHEFFYHNNLSLPPVHQFTSTLHGR